jgi:hypothetical protein
VVQPDAVAVAQIDAVRSGPTAGLAARALTSADTSQDTTPATRAAPTMDLIISRSL